MLTPANSTESWQKLTELRCQREIVERWLACRSLPEDLRQSLEAMLHEVEDQLETLTKRLDTAQRTPPSHMMQP